MLKSAKTKIILSLAKNPGTTGFRAHNTAFKELGIDYLYLPRKFDGDIKDALNAIRALGFTGTSLTMPYKIVSIPYLNNLSEPAKKIGAVNTVVNNCGELTGYNTDAPAAQKLLKLHFSWQKHGVVILGAGGMARAFAFALNKLGIKGFVAARNRSKGDHLAKTFNLSQIEWGDWEKLNDKIICNATPIGMVAGEKKIDFPAQIFSSFAGVFDAVANPPETWLVETAKRHNIITVTGDMLAIEQACLQFELYTGKKAPVRVMKKAIGK